MAHEQPDDDWWHEFEIEDMARGISARVQEPEPGSTEQLETGIVVTISGQYLSKEYKDIGLTMEEARSLGDWLIRTADKFKK